MKSRYERAWKIYLAKIEGTAVVALSDTDFLRIAVESFRAADAFDAESKNQKKDQELVDAEL